MWNCQCGCQAIAASLTYCPMCFKEREMPKVTTGGPSSDWEPVQEQPEVVVPAPVVQEPVVAPEPVVDEPEPPAPEPTPEPTPAPVAPEPKPAPGPEPAPVVVD